MHILILNHNAENHGTFFRCFFLAKHLTQRGHLVTLSCINSKKKILSTHKKKVDGINVLLLPSLGDNSISDLPRHILRAGINIMYGIENNFDIIHSFNVVSPTTGLPTVFFKLMSVFKVKKSKIIVDWDDWWGRGGLTKISGQGKFIESVATYLEENIPKVADSVTVVSQPIKERALGIGIKHDKIFKLINGANEDIIKPLDKIKMREELGLPHNKNILCFVCSVTTTIDFLMKVMKIIIKKKPNVLLIIISPLNKSQLEMMEKSEIRSNILAVGTQPYINVVKYQGASDILLLPRTNNVCDLAGFPARMMDYLCSGRPIVATALGELEIVIHDSNGGLLAHIDDADDFANKIITLIEDKALCDKLGKNGREAAESKYSWEKIADEFEIVYKITKSSS